MVSLKTTRLTRQRFFDLWNSCLAIPQSSQVDMIFNEIVQRYSEPHRHYHTLEHVDFCLGQLDQVKHLLESPAAIETALWFHDLIYIPGNKNNEVNSADRFATLAEGELDSQFIQQVHQFIVATVPGSAVQNICEQYIADIDLSSLALPWQEFQRDNQHLREEFSHLNDDEFRVLQFKFLQALINRPSVYLTEFFIKKQEKEAQQNISRLLQDFQHSPDNQTSD